MCFGTTTICERCQRPTVYLLPGIHRCSTRCKASHTITGPTSTTHSCWACRPTIPGSVDEVKEVLFWNHYADTFIGYADSLEESKALLAALTSEIEEASDEDVKRELEVLKRAEELRTREFEAATDRFTEWKKEGNLPIHVITPPPVGEAKPLTFKEWASKFGVEARDFDSKEDLTAWEALEFHDCDGYELYLEENDFEYELDLFRARNDSLRYIDRLFFDFDPSKLQAHDPQAEETEGLLSWRIWMRKERLGAIKWSEERMKAKSTAERFERDLNLYAVYLEDASNYWSKVFTYFRTKDTLTRRRRLNEGHHLIWDPDRAEGEIETTEVPPTANDEEYTGRVQWLRAASRCRHPSNGEEAKEEIKEANVKEADADDEDGPIVMTFAEWCASPLVPQDGEQNKNTDAALRADLKGYANYCSTFPHPMPEEYCAVRRRLDRFRAETFNYTPPCQSTEQIGQTEMKWPCGLSDFRHGLTARGFKPSMNSGWVEDTYVLYLDMFAEKETVGGFAQSRDWWARDDRRELEGLPRCDPLTTKITSVMQLLVQYIVSMEDPASRLAVEACLSPVLLMLDSCMEEHRELMTEQWEYIRATYHHAEAMAAVVRTREQRLARFSDQSHVTSQHTGVVESTRARLPQTLISAEGYYADNDSETDSEDEDGQFYSPVIHSPYIPDLDSDDEGSSDADDAGPEFSMIWGLAALTDDVETDEDEQRLLMNF
ncbi:uncharacterized protein K444DRAFT_630369 [Hyaloscypha bicolor E]|uniref:Uncharacterized protein n=1 Tax=Hyaloscypha bicolor E TaxID=1095630 RepID=A0A2J6T6L9_9HELO|nr:uncharacterized protein K444DRAFT_630369 [Hyaloscypha bicolor E]PMD58659.1 hypothetical protein K444DRAFT_630369 [Hyaloscypha bicolor E]